MTVVVAIVVLAVGLPFLIGVTFGTSGVYHAVPFSLIGGIGGSAMVIFLTHRGNRIHPSEDKDDRDDQDG